MLGPAHPTRITIDFGRSHPARAWVIDHVDSAGRRIELVAVEDGVGAPRPIDGGMLTGGTPCTCPEFCDCDHANE